MIYTQERWIRYDHMAYMCFRLRLSLYHNRHLRIPIKNSYALLFRNQSFSRRDL